MSEHNENIAKLNYKQAIIVAVITAVSTILVTLISSGFFGKKSEEIVEQDCAFFEKQIEKLEEQKAAALPINTLTAMSDKYFDRSGRLEAVLDSLRNLINYSNTLMEHRSHYTYKLFVIKKIMLKNPRGYINTRINNDARETYTIIQEILKELEYYDGNIDGDQQMTRTALESFQQKVNALDSGYFNPRDYGIFGNKTLVAVRNLYEHR